MRLLPFWITCFVTSLFYQAAKHFFGLHFDWQGLLSEAYWTGAVLIALRLGLVEVRR